MESDQAIEEQTHKKGRHRKKQLYNSILQQMEFYLSDSNLPKDKFLLPLIEQDEYLDLSIFLKFNKIKKLTTQVEDIVKALQRSELLEVSEDKTKVKRKVPLAYRENVEECTIYVERIKPDASHEYIASLFSDFGNVVYVSIPKYRHNKMNKGFAFVEFEKESDAKNVLEYFEKVGCKMSSHIAPEELCSVTSFLGEEKDGISVEDNQKKRKRSVENHGEGKKIKIDNEENGDEENEEKKKKKSKKNKNKNHFKELGIQVLSKHDWKKMRNKYLNNQREKMTQLKQYLYKKKFSNKYDDSKLKKSPCTSEDSKEVPENPDLPKIDYNPGLVVKVKLPEPCSDPKTTKAELKSFCSDIEYVNLPNSGSREVFVRFSNNESANKFCRSNFKGEAHLLTGDEEKDYWMKVKAESKKQWDSEYIPGIIVKAKLLGPCRDPKETKAELKSLCADVRYVDAPNTESEEVFIRFANSESANKFCTMNFKRRACVLQGNEEKAYWEKMMSGRTKCEPDYTPGVIVKAKLLEPCYNLNKTKEELKSLCSDIRYIYSPNVGSEEIFIRFSNNKSAIKFCEVDFKGEACILEGDEEKDCWEKIIADRVMKFNRTKKQSDMSEVSEKNEKPKTDYTPGVIVKAKLSEPCGDSKKTKVEFKSLCTDIQFVDIPNIGCEEIFIRFSNNESANKFCTVDYKGEAVVLEGKPEKDYWEKIKMDRTKKFEQQNKKQRGRDKLLKRAEKELGKHIKFDDSD